MPTAGFCAGEMMAPAVPVPVAPLRMMQMICAHVVAHGAAHVAVHRRAPVLSPESAAAHPEGGPHARGMKSAATARIRIAARKQNASDGDRNDGGNRSEHHGGQLDTAAMIHAGPYCPAAADELRR